MIMGCEMETLNYVTELALHRHYIMTENCGRRLSRSAVRLYLILFLFFVYDSPLLVPPSNEKSPLGASLGIRI
jgi:hypothetical protein